MKLFNYDTHLTVFSNFMITNVNRLLCRHMPNILPNFEVLYLGSKYANLADAVQ